MKIKKKTMMRDEWPDDTHKRILIREEKINEKHALIGLIWWTDGAEKLRVSDNTLLIKDENYTWLEIALEGEYYWITAMYDANDEFIEAYFDLNSRNIIKNENPYFFDMFTDIIISKDGSVHILDEDELDKAYEDNLISESDYLRTKKITKELYEYIRNNTESILKSFAMRQQYYKEQMLKNMV